MMINLKKIFKIKKYYIFKKSSISQSTMIFLAFIDQTLRLFWSVSTTQEGPSYLLFYI